jgi:von Willebrand factor type A domain
LVVCLLSVPVAQAAPFALTAATTAAAGQPTAAKDTLLDVVMLIDESGSEPPVSVTQEKQVAATIGQSMLNPASRVSVVGFGGVNNVAPNQDPINVACQPTIATGAQNLNYLSTCVNSLHRRTEAEGNDTDYAPALGQAMTYLNPNTADGKQSPPGAQKVILMMTDGGVDVHRDTKQYGSDWLNGEKQAVNEQLALARQYGVQVWTLGMGTDISSADQQYLQYLAQNGAQSTCGSGRKPHATLVTNRSDALAALNELYAEASCSGRSVTPWIPLGAGTTSGTLHVTIPGIASSAAITVDRGNPGVQVRFYEPNGTLWTDSSALSGDGSAVDVLHLTNPMPGTWTMQLVAPPSLQNELVGATAFWQGAVRALIIANPPSAQPGERISVTLSVLGSNGSPITDPATVKDLRAGVVVSGDGVAQVAVPVSNTGETNAAGTGVANYTGSFKAPAATGTLTFSGTARGYGLYVTDIPASVQISPVAAGLQATVQFPAAASVQTGSRVQGNVVFANSTGAAKSVRIALSNVSNADAALSSPTGLVSVPAGSPPQQPFTISFAKDSVVGSSWLRLRVTDAASPGVVYADQLLNITVTKPPGFLAKYLWVLIGIFVLIALIIAAALLLRANRRAQADVRSLRAVISRDGDQKGNPLSPSGKWSDVFPFVILDEDNEYARLAAHTPDSGDPVYTARRAGPGRVRVWTPAGTQYEITVGSAGEELENGLRLSFRDTRKRRPGLPIGGPSLSRRGSTPRGSDGPRGSGGPSTQPVPPASQPSPQPAYDSYGQPSPQPAYDPYGQTSSLPQPRSSPTNDEWL